MPRFEDYCGWAYDIAEMEFLRFQSSFTAFQLYGNVRSDPGVPIWEFAKRVNGGQHLPTWRQETGDCVSMGVVQAGQYLQCFEIAFRGQEETFHPWFPPYVYGTSRVQVGGGNLRGPGSTGAWAAKAMQDFGILFSNDQGVPSYSGRLADQWGDRPGPAQEFMQLARDNPVKSVAKLVAVDQIRDALNNYKPCTYAIMWPYDVQEVDYQGFHVMQRGKILGGHQVSLLAWMDDPFPAAYCLNSWGMDKHGRPRYGEPPGGAWLRAEDIEQDLRDNRSEVYTMSAFEGFPGPPNWSPL